VTDTETTTAQEATGNRLSHMRRLMRLNQHDFGRFVGRSTRSRAIAPNVVSRHETGYKRISHHHVLLYAKALNIYTYEVFHERIDGRDPKTISPPPNRIEDLARRSRLWHTDVATLMGITEERLRRHIHGRAFIRHDEVLRYARIFKVWTYEVFQPPVHSRSYDLWVASGGVTSPVSQIESQFATDERRVFDADAERPTLFEGQAAVGPLKDEEVHA
jgi:plasmid maintenance system antidote protein VapI